MWMEDARVYKDTTKRELLMKLAGDWLRKSVKSLVKLGDLRHKVGDMAPDMLQKFSFQELNNLYRQKCPELWQFMRKLSEPFRDSKGSGAPDILAPAPAPAAKWRKTGMPTKDRDLMICTSMSILLYGYSWQCNRFQSIMGYWLYVENTHKNSMEVLYALGIATSYPHVHRTEMVISENAMSDTLIRVKEEPFLLTWDNINRKMRVREEVLYSKEYMISWTTGGIIFLKADSIQGGDTEEVPPVLQLHLPDIVLPRSPTIPKGWVNEKLRSILTGKDFMLSKEAIAYHTLVF
ncbi:hypothetical protein L211DRAFT_848285 [Terfezia boudieri ATCC MYA-4762]|uniref:Uncharacterized protein n=1 Tax=Terfezia boudieri ATCC MYA-4762 TaxID=1051890 RepID=A0A3N4LPY7_9PEZI|nr:hypothetical protein L211DRAFT_848285 [Terfezia boudieri ATCC MYA-4762]